MNCESIVLVEKFWIKGKLNESYCGELCLIVMYVGKESEWLGCKFVVGESGFLVVKIR